MTTTRYLCAAGLILAAALILAVSVIFWPRIAPLLQRRPKPQTHEGATAQWATKLHALKDAPVAPELVSDVERELAWGLLWHEFEHAMQTAIDAAFAPVLAELNRPWTFAELYELVFPEALHEDTREMALVGARAAQGELTFAEVAAEKRRSDV